jgi:hypothetical protein
MASLSDPDYWPPALTASEEILFVGSLARCLTAGEVESKVWSEKQRRLQRPNYPPGYEENHRIRFVVDEPLHPEGQHIAALLPDFASRLAKLGRDMPGCQSPIQPVSVPAVEESHDRSESETLERLLPRP